MRYSDIVECIKINQIKQCISVNTLAKRVCVTPQVITDIRGYRLKVSRSLFEKIIKELSIIDLTDFDKEQLLSNQERAKDNKHKKYLKEKEKRLMKVEI